MKDVNLDNKLFSLLGNFSSLLGLVISLLTLFLLYKIRKKFLFRSSIKEYKKELLDLTKDMNTLFNSFSKNINEINEKIAIADVKLRVIEKGANDNLQKDIKSARSKIKYYNRKEFIFFGEKKNKLESTAREIKLLIVVITHELDNVQKEINVGGH